jgi:Fe-S cluster assembly ATP-binding protein
MIKIENLTVKVGNKEILKDFSLEINDGEIVALMGPNGIGKSTICKVIMGDDNYEVVSGSITYNGINLLDLSVDERSRRGICLVGQNPLEIEGVSNADMLRAALESKTAEHVNFFEFNKMVTSICDKLNIPASFIHRGINEGMSGGEKKKNELLHLLILKPTFIMLDEFDSGLDVDSLKLLSLALKEYLNDTTSVLIVTHHKSILEYLVPDKVNILKNGKIIKSGDKSLADDIEREGFSTIDVGETSNAE